MCLTERREILMKEIMKNIDNEEADNNRKVSEELSGEVGKFKL